MTLQIRTQVVSNVTDTCRGISSPQTHTYDDTESTTNNLNVTTSTYELPSCSNWVQVANGDIGVIRDIYVTLTSTPQTDNNVGVIITDADPNTGPSEPAFFMRETFVATTNIADGNLLYLKNYSCMGEASITVMLGGQNV